jgi:hypothetical protein
MLPTSEQPDIPEQSNDKRKEDQPHLPSHTSLLCHAQHTIHSTLELITRIRELIIHLFRQRSRVANLVANAQSKLFGHTGSALPFSFISSCKGVLLTSFNMPTFLLISDTCSSFCDSNSLSTASLYAPRLSGVAVRKLAAPPA